MEHLFISCAVDNHASARTCELAGGQFLGIFEVPADNELREDMDEVRIYRFELK